MQTRDEKVTWANKLTLVIMKLESWTLDRLMMEVMVNTMAFAWWRYMCIDYL